VDELPAQPESTGPSSPPPVSWRRNLFAVTAACFIGFAGFTLVMPFLPLYFQQLGITGVADVAFWSGISLGVTPGITAVLAPLWGRVADRYGRKLLVERSLICFVFTMIAMAYVQSPWHVFGLRVLQGFFAGYGALALAMAADSAPPGKMASAIGMVQTAQRLGPALGPVIGGVLAQMVGLRQSFWFAGGFYAIGFVLVFLVYREPAGAGAPLHTSAASGAAKRVSVPRATFADILAVRYFLLVSGVIFATQFVDRSLGPILPLYVAELGVPEDRVPLISGVLFAVLAAAAALGHHWCGKLLRRFSARTVIAAGSGVAGGGMLLFILAPIVPMLVLAVAIFGIAVGAAMTAAYTTAGSIIPTSARGTGFGLLTTASLTAMAMSPATAGFIAARSIRFVFAIDIVMLAIVSLVVMRTMAASLRVDLPHPAPESDAAARETVQEQRETLVISEE
jgi:MFS transporter, DHA1 family, multidrug resistance protein